MGKQKLLDSWKESVVLKTCHCSFLTLSFVFTSSVFVLSIDTEEQLVSLSLLPKDTGKSDILPESLGLPLHLIGEENKKREVQKRNSKRKLSESEQVTHSLVDLNAHVLSSSTSTDRHLLSFPSGIECLA